MTRPPDHYEACDLHDLAHDGPQPWTTVYEPLLRQGWVTRERDTAVITERGRYVLARARDRPRRAAPTRQTDAHEGGGDA
jgi:hypothetical protein